MKYLQIQAPRSNRGRMWIGEDEQQLIGSVEGRNGFELSPGDVFTVDIDHVRTVSLDLRDILFSGVTEGDKLSVVYLEEEDNG